MTRVKPTPAEYTAMVDEAMQAPGNEGWAAYLSERFDRDYPRGADE